VIEKSKEIIWTYRVKIYYIKTMKQGTSYTQYNKHFLCRYWLRN